MALSPALILKAAVVTPFHSSFRFRVGSKGQFLDLVFFGRPWLEEQFCQFPSFYKQ